MMHKPIIIKDLGLSFSGKSCFEHFSTEIYPGSRIAIIGRNGSGKSSLLNILRQHLNPSEGQIVIPKQLCVGYVEQTITGHDDLSGGQRLNKRLSEALALSPDLLLLDEPTNHLDLANRKSLIRMLQKYQGTLIIVSHDKEVLRKCIDTFWHIENNKIQLFSGSYDDYAREKKQKRASIEKELSTLKRGKKETHASLMKEQKRAAKSKHKGEKSVKQKKWMPVVSNEKKRGAEQTTGKKKTAIDKNKQELSEKLSELTLPKVILPKFSIAADQIGNRNILTITNANIAFEKNKAILKNINISVSSKDHVAISGDNASGKSTLLKAMLGERNIIKTGNWFLPKPEHIGHLDQHYSNLNPELSVIEHVLETRPDWNENEARQHLNDFLFRKNKEVHNLTSNLSGGEKARLSLALIAAKTPRLLILDEITNNLDLETKEHVIQVLQAYPGAMIVVSHEQDFIDALNITHKYEIKDGHLSQGPS